MSKAEPNARPTTSPGKLPFGPFTGRFQRLLLIALLPLLSSACSHKPLVTQMPLPPADLAQACSPLPEPPSPLIDPDRSMWELEVIALYGDCASRHAHLAASWGR